MSFVIGINAFHADSSAAIFKDGELLFAIEEEKLIRQKHWAGFPIQSIKKCLEYCNINGNEVSDVSINSNPYSNLIKKVPFFLKNYLTGQKKKEIFLRIKNKVQIKKYLINNFNFNHNIKVHYIDHHLSHIASSFFPSGFEESLAISVDGFGDFSSLNIAKCNKKKIEILDKIFFPDSLGIFYEMMTQLLGFKNYGDEYKLMGLASYGEPIYFEKIKDALFQKSELFKLNCDYFNHNKKNFSYKFEGLPKQNEIFSNKIYNIFTKEELIRERKNIAASTQKIYEHFLIKVIKYALSLYKSENLCLSGGCALNSSANGKIIKNLDIKKIFIPYAPADGGGAIGSALTVLTKKYSISKFSNLKNPYLGPEYSNEHNNDAIKKISNKNFKIKKILDENELYLEVVKKIAKGNIVGWFQGKIEFGARALGNRSILADPRNPNIKEIINLKIKKREDFRPFAPSILTEFKKDWFEENYFSFYMEAVLKIKKEKKNLVPAVTHIDETCRLQAVDKISNPKFYNLISNFYKITNVPMLLNTSFNENEPIVCSPEQAIDCFLRTKMDDLVLNDTLISRN